MTTSSFTFVEHWQKDCPDDAEAVLAFWKRENAINDEASAKKRLGEIVLHARDATGAIAGVSTAVPITLPRLGQPTYYFRCFVGKDWRKSRLVLQLLRRTCETLEAFARTHNFPCIGVILEMENARFGEALQRAWWPSTGFVFIGKSQRGLDLRVRYFRGAKLKPAKL
ncbi:MAG: hypothetical protein JSS33_00430 [Proteobacteria bacterium]|nr:hypothetical protein [Pseudomonadota bacterium]